MKSDKTKAVNQNRARRAQSRMTVFRRSGLTKTTFRKIIKQVRGAVSGEYVSQSEAIRLAGYSV